MGQGRAAPPPPPPSIPPQMLRRDGRAGRPGSRVRPPPPCRPRPFEVACVAAHHPPLAPVEGTPHGVGSSSATPACAPCMTCRRGPCACCTWPAWGVAAPPSSPPPAVPAVARTAWSHRRQVLVARFCSLLVRPRLRHALVARPRSLVGQRRGRR